MIFQKYVNKKHRLNHNYFEKPGETNTNKNFPDLRKRIKIADELPAMVPIVCLPVGMN